MIKLGEVGVLFKFLKKNLSLLCKANPANIRIPSDRSVMQIDIIFFILIITSPNINAKIAVTANIAITSNGAQAVAKKLRGL